MPRGPCPADFYVGVEGGLGAAHDNGTQRVFLESWAEVSNGQRHHFGCSGSVPDALANEVLHRSAELGVAKMHGQAAAAKRCML